MRPGGPASPTSGPSSPGGEPGSPPWPSRSPSAGSSPTSTPAPRWPYTVVGAAFAIYGVALIAYGSSRARQVMDALSRGQFSEPSDKAITALTAAGALLGLATLALIIFD